MQALRQFVHMIAPWPQFCAAVLANPQLREADPELYARVEQAQQADNVTGNGALPTMSAVGAGEQPQVVPDAAVEQARHQQVQQQQQQSQSGSTDANQQGSSRFLNLQPAENTTLGPVTTDEEAATPAAPAASLRSVKDAGPSSRPPVGAPGGAVDTPATGTVAPGSKGGTREAPSGVTGLTSVSAATAPSGQMAHPSNTMSGEVLEKYQIARQVSFGHGTHPSMTSAKKLRAVHCRIPA